MNAKQLIISATGFPGTNKTLRFLQDAYQQPLEAITRILGDKVILSGVVVNNDGVNPPTVSDGYIAIDGMIIPFVAGDYASTVTVFETVENATYNTDINNDNALDNLPAYKTRAATCGTGGVDIYDFSDFVRLDTIKNLTPLKDIVTALQLNDDLQQTSINGLNARETKKHIIIQSGVKVDSAASSQLIFSNGITLGKLPIKANRLYRFDISVYIQYIPSVAGISSSFSLNVALVDAVTLQSPIANVVIVMQKGTAVPTTAVMKIPPFVSSSSDTSAFGTAKATGFIIPLSDANIAPKIGKDVLTNSNTGTINGVMIVEDLGLASDYTGDWT